MSIVLEPEELEKWRKAGKIAAQALEYGRKLIIKGVSMREICDAVDLRIHELGAKPAWPTQIGCDEIAAHYTPDPEDQTLFDKQLVCLDVGAQIEGCIGDNACTVDLSGQNLKLAKAAEDALNTAIKTAGIGVQITELGRVIEETITAAGFRPVKNLSGHGISPYIIHDKPTIPNFNTGDKQQLKKGQIIAIEPFATNGGGSVAEAGKTNIFALAGNQPVRNPSTRQIMEFIEENYNNLPFTTRWLTKHFPKGTVQIALNELERAGNIHKHPPLVERSKGLVSVCEKTIRIDEKVEIIT